MSPESLRDLRVCRFLLALAGSVYLLWWFAVQVTLPNSFNPFASRAAVVLTIFAVLGLSYVSDVVRSQVRLLFNACMWLITFHYFYLFQGNGGDANWIVGAYITIIAVTFLFVSNAALLSYSFFVLAVGIFLQIKNPPLQHSVFLPGLITLIAQANIGLNGRLTLIKNLAASNSRFRLLLDSTFEGIFVHDFTRITDVNESLLKMTGFSRDELIGADLFTIFVASEHDVIRTNMAKPVAAYETVGRRKDGSSFQVEVRGSQFVYKNEVSRLVTMLDITDRNRAEEQKIATRTMAENVRVRDEFISLASHELKTPITSLRLQTQMFERDLKKGTPGVLTKESMTELLGLFGRQITRLTELVDSMLDVSRISSGRLNLDLKDVDLAKLTREVVSSLGFYLAQSKGSEISIDTPESLKVWADESRLKQVIENLVTNAIKYGNGKPIEVKVKTQGIRAVVSVRDHGIGIAPEFHEKIFGRFERGVSSQNIGGLGLGLYIARQIVDAHGGSLTVESKPGEGSEFCLRLRI